MCSIGEDDFGDEGGVHAMIAEPKPSSAIESNEICKKCNVNIVSVKLNLKDAQCESCFFQFARHKFRASLGTTRIVERGANVALVFDGSVESCVLLDMMKYAVRQEQFKRLTFKPFGLFIDDTAASETDAETRLTIVRDSLKLLLQFGFESYYASVAHNSQVVRVDCAEGFEFPKENLDKDKQFHATVTSTKSLTSQDDYVLIARYNAIRHASKQINCKYAFLSSVNHQIAATLLTNVALGRGSSVANDISFADNRANCPTKLLRPIRNLTALEIETYVRLQRDVNWPRENRSFHNSISKNSNASIQNLTRNFVDGLQENFASTISTVFRTGDKIASANEPTNAVAATKRTCRFCNSFLDYENSTTLFAIEYSRCVSSCADRNDVNDINLMTRRANDAVEGRTMSEDENDVRNLCANLCHGCRNIFRDFNDESLCVEQLKC